MLLEMAQHIVMNTVFFPGLISVGRIQVSCEVSELRALSRLTATYTGPTSGAHNSNPLEATRILPHESILKTKQYS